MRRLYPLFLILLCCATGADVRADAVESADGGGGEAEADLGFVLPDTAALLTPENLATLEKGDVVSQRVRMEEKRGASRGGGTVLVLVDRPVDVVWIHLLNYADYAEYLPRVRKVEKYLEDEDRLGLKLTARIVVRTIVQHVINTMDPDNHTITWALDQSQENDIRDTRGAWILVPHGEGRTIVVYAIEIDMGWRLPKWLENFMLRRDLPDFPLGLKKYAESKP